MFSVNSIISPLTADEIADVNSVSSATWIVAAFTFVAIPGINMGVNTNTIVRIKDKNLFDFFIFFINNIKPPNFFYVIIIIVVIVVIISPDNHKSVTYKSLSEICL